MWKRKGDTTLRVCARSQLGLVPSCKEIRRNFFSSLNRPTSQARIFGAFTKCRDRRRYAAPAEREQDQRSEISTTRQSCTAYCTAVEYNLPLFLRLLNEKPLLDFKVDCAAPKFVRLVKKTSQADFLIFSFGSFVSWGAEESEIKALQELLRPVEKYASTSLQKEYFKFGFDKTGSAAAVIKNEEIILREDTLAAKLPTAYAIAQAVKVDLFENIVHDTMKSVEIIPREMAAYGRIKSLSGHQLNTSMGRILLTWTQVRLDDTELFSTPDQFWEQPDQEKTWEYFFRYLDVPRRVKTLDHQLSFISDIHEGLKAEAQAKHASKLEKIIIALIAIEVAFGLADHAHYFTFLSQLF